MSRRVVWIMLGCILVVWGIVPSIVFYNDGTMDMPFDFRVVNAKTGEPLSGVKIRIIEWPSHQRWWEIKTGADGRASIELTCMAACMTRKGLLLHISYKSIYYPDHLVTVSATGFKDTEPAQLTDLVGQGYVGDYRPPPEVEIKMEPAVGG